MLTPENRIVKLIVYKTANVEDLMIENIQNYEAEALQYP
jgi:hypothetical protein